MTSNVNTRDLSEREADANSLEGYRPMVAELRERLEAVRALHPIGRHVCNATMWREDGPCDTRRALDGGTR